MYIIDFFNYHLDIIIESESATFLLLFIFVRSKLSFDVFELFCIVFASKSMRYLW